MLNYSKSKTLAILGVALVILAAGILTFFERSAIDKWLASLPMFRTEASIERLGGTQLLLELDVNELRHNLLLKPLAHDARAKLREARILYDGRPAVVGDSVRVRLARPEDIDRANKAFLNLRNDLKITKKADGQLMLTPTKAEVQALIIRGTEAAIAVIRQRIDALNLGWPSTTRRQSENRVLVQFPGLFELAKVLNQSPRLKRVIGMTAALSIRLVHPTITAVEARATRIPLRYVILPSDEGGEELVLDHAVIGISQFASAQAGTDPLTGEPVLHLKMYPRGARTTENVTRRNIGRRLAMVLDHGTVAKRDIKGKKILNKKGHEIRIRDIRVLMAPKIHSAILGGSIQVSGKFSREEIETLAIQLNSGPLPASLTILEEATIAPNLDSK